MGTVIWLRRLLTCLILFLMICNLAYLTINYAKYGTDTNVAPYWPVKLNATKLSLCFSISSLLDRSPHSYSIDTDQSIKYINLTFHEVFQRMPSVSSTLKSCKYRDFDLDILHEERDGRKCAELFKVIRYRMQGYICYRFTFPLDQEYSFHRLVNSLYNPRELYHLRIAQPFSDQHILYPLLHFDELPNEARAFNGEIYSDSGSLFQVSYDMVEANTLPSPYETHCVSESQISCYERCLTRAQRKLGYSADSDLIVENSSAAHLRLMPLDTSINLQDYRSSCYSKCPHEACSRVSIDTRSSKTDSKKEKLLFIVQTVNKLITKIEYLPAFPLTDYITQVGAVVSIWAGVSVITLSELIQSRRKVALKTFFLAVKVHFMAVRLILSSRQRRRARKDALSLEKERLVTKLKRVSILAKLFRVSLLPFLVWQLSNVAKHYFLFQTTAKFNYDLNPEVTFPTLGLCFEYEDSLNVHSMETAENTYHQLFLDRDSKFNRTAKSLLEDATEDVIDGCFIRHWSSRFKWFKYNNGTGCLRYFSVKKFYSNRKLCYQILPMEELDEVNYKSDVKLLLVNPGVIYIILLSSKVPIPRKMNIFTQYGDDLPLISVEFSVEVYKSDMNDMILFSNRLYQFELLPAPYDTSCNPTSGRAECLNACISKALSRYKRLSYGMTENSRLDMRFLSYSDLLNDSVNEMWRQTELSCDKKCLHFMCERNFTTTFMEGEIAVKNLQNAFAVDLPSHPTVEMKTVPVMTLYKFVYEILCCFSFWLGVSWIDLKPMTVSMKQRMKIKIYLTQLYLVVDRMVNKFLRPYKRASCLMNVKELNSRKVVNFLLSCSVMSFCFCHLIYSMTTYMSYLSLIDVFESIETRTDLNLHICLDSAELISRKFPTRIHDPLVARSVIMNRTITSLFSDTPREDELIRECGYWGLHSRMANLSHLDHVSDRIFFFTKNKAICDQVYEVHKFIVQSYMCYSVRPRHYTGWNTFQMKHALNQKNTLLEVSVDSSLLTKRFTLMVDELKWVPFTSSCLAHNIIRDPKYDQFKVSYIRYTANLLPSPRTIDGFVPFMFDRCLSHCVNQKFKMFNLTLSTRFKGPSNLRFVSYLHRKQNTLKIPFNQIQNECEVGCLDYNDHMMKGQTELVAFVPTVDARRRKSKTKGDLTTISLRSTHHPILNITYKLKISLFQQIINLGSILGLWFGFSAVTLARMGRIRDKEVGPEELLSQKQRIRTLRANYRIR